jgi:NTE family protein
MKNTFYPKIGLALGSGGAKGLAHIGVLKSFEKHNIPINCIAGASIGSIIGAHYARHQSIKRLEDLVLSFGRKKGIKLADWTIQGGFMKGEKTEQFIEEILEGTQFTDLKIPLAVVATDMNAGTSVVFSEGDLIKAIRASISIPAFYQPIMINNILFVDGGLSNPVPVDIVKSLGAEITIAVNLDSVYTEKPFKKIPSLAQIPLHAISILQHNLALHDVQDADVVISPPNILHIGFLGWNYFFDNDKAMKIIQAGEDAADAMMPEIRRKIASFKNKQSRIKRVLRFLLGE